jgi:hypothetical protein
VTSALEYFLSNYFHQDFNVEFGSVWGAVNAFVSEEPGLAQAVPEEIEHLLATRPEERDLDEYLTRLGCQYLAQPDDGGYRGWLTEIARRVAAATRTPED